MRHLSLVIAMATAGLLVACGGSPSNSTPSTGGGTSLTLSGVAAKGAALASASVEAVCAAGTGTATAGADGSYTLTVTNGALPCVLEATGTGADAGLVLHSVATGTGSTATSNITPVTELLVAQLTGQDPAAFMAAANATTLNSTVTTTNVNAAKTEIIATLSAAGLDTTALGTADMVSGTLAAGTGSGYDGVLDALGTALASSGTTLAQLTQAVVNPVAGNSPVTEVGTPASALPADLLLRPKAANCDALRSTNYRIIKIAASAGPADAPNTATEVMSLNAQTLTATFSPDDTMNLTANGTCRYTLPGGGDAVVSPAGVIVMRNVVGSDDDTVGAGDRGAARMMIALPMQDLSVADLAGEYAFIGFDRNPLETYGGYATLTANGTVNAFRCWADAFSVAEAACTPLDSSYTEVFSKNNNGSFTWGSSPADADQWTDTAYAYRAGNGDILLVALTDSGEPSIGVKRRVLTLPSVNDTYANWSMHVDGNLVAAAVTTSVSHTVTSVDAASGSAVRTSVEQGAGTTTQTIAYNSGRAGYISRPAGTGVRPFNGLSAPGFGLSALYLPEHNGQVARFSLSVRQ